MQSRHLAIGRQLVVSSGPDWRGCRARRPTPRLWGDEPTSARMLRQAERLCRRLEAAGDHDAVRRIKRLQAEHAHGSAGPQLTVIVH